ncbi:hypothetical protein NPIL_365301 [Nephila pilipes]|uniref:Uncharacterized protein n=1 Tax=Nephila pilipes TaxID=299642 RepID=A0A8X6T271_NEPPI|nr:hypothetical protein NPIL_365301 [Nephila pilipes]
MKSYSMVPLMYGCKMSSDVSQQINAPRNCSTVYFAKMPLTFRLNEQYLRRQCAYAKVGRYLRGIWTIIYQLENLKSEFKRGRNSLGNYERSELNVDPRTETTKDNIPKFQHMVSDDRRIKVRERAVATNMYKELICPILNQDLGMRKLSAH